jgi:GNAT superfamily N-acetyltransferase
MDILVQKEPMTALAEYARTPMSLQVTEILDLSVEENGFGGFALAPRRLDTPYVKDYDAVEAPREWPALFDLSNWQLFSARSDGAWVGGATAAMDSPDLIILEGKKDLAILWDIRVAPDMRRQGVGTALFRAVERWARERGCRRLKIETQNVNVPACRFYRKQGCVLSGIHRFIYDEFPDEVQLLWYKDL